MYYQLSNKIAPTAFPTLQASRSRVVKVPTNDSDLRVNPAGYLNVGLRALPGLARNAPRNVKGAPIRVGEEQAAILIATASGAFDGPIAFGRGDNFIQPEKTRQE